MLLDCKDFKFELKSNLAEFNSFFSGHLPQSHSLGARIKTYLSERIFSTKANCVTWAPFQIFRSWVALSILRGGPWMGPKCPLSTNQMVTRSSICPQIINYVSSPHLDIRGQAGACQGWRRGWVRKTEEHGPAPPTQFDLDHFSVILHQPLFHRDFWNILISWISL